VGCVLLCYFAVHSNLSICNQSEMDLNWPVYEAEPTQTVRIRHQQLYSMVQISQMYMYQYLSLSITVRLDLISLFSSTSSLHLNGQLRRQLLCCYRHLVCLTTPFTVHSNIHSNSCFMLFSLTFSSFSH
jgi:hypothetical protein